MEIIKVMKTVRHQTKKDQISKENENVAGNAESSSRN